MVLATADVHEPDSRLGPAFAVGSCLSSHNHIRHRNRRIHRSHDRTDGRHDARPGQRQIGNRLRWRTGSNPTTQKQDADRMA
jgi:hypothetical protein